MYKRQLDDTHAHHHKDGHVHEVHTHAGGVEPHIWNSTINAQIIAGNILNALCACLLYTSREFGGERRTRSGESYPESKRREAGKKEEE